MSKPSPNHPVECLRDKLKQDFSKDENEERGNWPGRLDFSIACLVSTIGLGNIWKFPYLCSKYGGGTFIFASGVVLLLLGTPLFLLETSLGQYTSQGVMSCWEYAPILNGIGISMVVVSAMIVMYYNTLLANALWHGFYSIIHSNDQNWLKCDNEWNTPYCSGLIDSESSNLCQDNQNRSIFNTSIDADRGLCMGSRLLTFGGKTSLYHNVPIGEYAKNWSQFLKVKNVWLLPTEEFYYERVKNVKSHSMDDFGSLQWEMVISLFAVWLVIFLVLMKGIRVYGKVAYFTIFIKILLLLMVFVRAMTLSGASEGLKLLGSFNVEDLKTPSLWGDAAEQIFFSLNIGLGSLISLASYNRFHYNIVKDTVTLPFFNFLTSIICTLLIYGIVGADVQNVPELQQRESLLQPGANLVFVLIPYSLKRSSASSAWTVIFYFLLLLMGIDFSFCSMLNIIGGVSDKYRGYFESKRWLFCLLSCLSLFALSLPFTCNAGLFLVQLMDIYVTKWSALIISILECLMISYLYGGKKFTEDISIMLGDSRRFPWIPWRKFKYVFIVLWSLLSPVITLLILIYGIVEYEEPTYGKYNYTKWAEYLGILFGIFPVVVLFLVAVIYLIYYRKNKSSFISALKASKYWGPNLTKHRVLIAHSNSFEVDPYKKGIDFCDLLKMQMEKSTTSNA